MTPETNQCLYFMVVKGRVVHYEIMICEKNNKLCFWDRSSCTSASSNYAPSKEHISKRILKLTLVFPPLGIYQFDSSRLPYNSHLRPHCSRIVEFLQSHSWSAKSYNSPAKRIHRFRKLYRMHSFFNI